MTMLKIESASNDTYRKYLSLTQSRGLKKEGLFLLSGEKLIREFLAKPHLGVVQELVTPSMAPLFETGAKTIQLSTELFHEIDVLGTHFNILVVEQPQIETLNDLSDYTPQGLEVVMPIGDPGNLGALIRSCEAFDVSKVILSEEAAHPFLPKSVKASAGSVLRVLLSRGPTLRTFPKSCIALDMQGTKVQDFVWPKNAILAVGEEGAGFGDAAFDRRICIPTKGVESLNVVVAASIALAHRAMKN